MGSDQRESLDLLRAFEEDWPRPGDQALPPDWRRFLLPDGHPRWARHVIAVWKCDLELRIARGMGPFPLVRTFADTEEGRQLAEDDLFELIEFEYRQCWRRNIRSVTRAKYQRQFPELDDRIEKSLRVAWDCPNLPDCGRVVEGAEEDLEALSCPHCGFTLTRSDLARGGAATTTPTAGGPSGPAVVAQPPTFRLGQYEIGLHLADGGMGVVYEGLDHGLGRRVAVKLLKPEFAALRTARDRFLREAHAQGSVQHENVVPIYYAGEQNGAVYLAMALLTGETLQARLTREGRLPSNEVARLGRQAASGLAAAHERGLVHRDLKPGNLWLGHPGDNRPRVLLMDFGLARLVDGRDRLTSPGAVAGTYPYMSPEQAASRKVDARSDLFALGCVLYEALTGRRAFPGDTPAEILRAVTETNPRPAREVVPEVDQTLSDLIDELVAKKSSDRPQAAAEVADRLDRIEARLSHGRRSSLVLGSLLLTGSLAAWLIIPSDWLRTAIPPKPDTTEHEKSPGLHPILAEHEGSVDLIVHRKDLDGSDVAYPLSDVRAWPIKPGDHVKVDARVYPASYIYLFWIDETGSSYPLYPWIPLKWGTRPASEQKATHLEVKDPDGNWFKIGGKVAGMETLLMLARPEALAATDQEIQAWFHNLRPLAFGGEKARAWFQGFDLVTHDPTRTIEYGGDMERDDSPLGLLAVLRQRIGEKAGFSRAVSFARLGIKEGK